MNIVQHARAVMDRQLVAYMDKRPSVKVEAVEAILCEDHATVQFVAHLSDGTGIAVNVDLEQPTDPTTFDENAWLDLFRPEQQTVH